MHFDLHQWEYNYPVFDHQTQQADNYNIVYRSTYPVTECWWKLILQSNKVMTKFSHAKVDLNYTFYSCPYT